jgi:hypothetical protein
VARALDPAAEALLARWRAWAFPGGEEAARTIRAVEWREAGEIRSSLKARWMPFTATQRSDATRSAFRWDAVIGTGALTRTAVTDAFEEGRGFLTARAAGVVPVARIEGPETDRGEIQRYLADLGRCPTALLLHPTLEFASAGEGVLRARDAAGPEGATVDLELGPEGAPVAVRAMRFRAQGRRFVEGPWSGRMTGAQEWEGLRVPVGLTVSWHLPEGEFAYFRAEGTPIRAVR